MSTTIHHPWHRRSGRAIAVGLFAALLLASCGGSGGSEAADTTEAKATTTAPKDDAEETTTTEADDSGEEEGGLPTTEADAPSGDWIMVRFQVAVEPEPDDYQPGGAEARLYDIEPDCSDDEGCVLTISGGGENGSFGMPDTEELTGDPLILEPDGDQWVDTTELDPLGCTEELDGPYLDTVEERELSPATDDDGEIVGLVGTLVYTDTLTDEGREAGCPDSSEATYAYAMVVAPNDGIRAIDGYDVDGRFRQTSEVTASEGYVNPLLQVGGISTTFPENDVELSGSCADGECSVDFTQINGDGDERSTELTSDDGRGLNGSFEEVSGCSNGETGEMIFEEGAYEGTGTYEDLTPVWVEDGEVKAFVGRYTHESTPTAQGETDPNCSTPESVEAWVYLVDTEVLG